MTARDIIGVSRAFARDRRGNVAMTASVAMVVLLSVVGAAIDFSLTSNSQSKAQDYADIIALRMTKYVAQHDKVPTSRDKGGYPAGTYAPSDFGLDFGNMVEGGNDGVSIILRYDETNREAIVSIAGANRTSFAQIMGVRTVDFSARAVAAFENKDVKDVASIVLVLDNSGSMRWDDEPYSASGLPPIGASSRMSGLKSSLTSLMSYLKSEIGDQTGDDPKILRMGMLPYHRGVISGLQQDMSWSLIPATKISAMVADGGTMPSEPLETALSWLKNEPAIHIAETGKTPRRYVVLMTDGANDQDAGVWSDKSGTGEWKRKRCRYSLTDFEGWGCWEEFEYSEDNPPAGSTGFWKSMTRYDYPWVEGELTRPEDAATLAQCQALKNEGVTVYTIAYGLTPGTYGRGGTQYDIFEGKDMNTIEVNARTTTLANEVLSECATSNETFIQADSADDLKEAFAFIAQSIVDEPIRLKS